MPSSVTIIHPDTITSSVLKGTGIYLGGPDYGLVIRQGPFMDSADVDLQELKKGDKDGAVAQGFTLKPGNNTVNAQIHGFPTALDPTGAADVERKFDRIKRVISPDRGELFWKFDFKDGLGTGLDKMILAKRNGPIISAYKGGGLTRRFQFNLMVPSGVQHGTELQVQSGIVINSDPDTFNEPSEASEVIQGNKSTKKLAFIEILNDDSSPVTGNITLSNAAVDIDGNQVTAGQITWTLGLGVDYTLKIDIQREHAQWKHDPDTGGSYVDKSEGLDVTSVFPRFVGQVRNTWSIGGMVSAAMNLQYLPEFE